MFTIDENTLDICMSYANTGAVEFAIYAKDEEISTVNDMIYVSIFDNQENEIFEKLYAIEEIATSDGTVFMWTFKLTHNESKAILPGDYTWDFTYWKDVVVTSGKPTDGTVVQTPFCERARAQFRVQDTNSTALAKPS